MTQENEEDDNEGHDENVTAVTQTPNMALLCWCFVMIKNNVSVCV
jgi:hypothetical protein